MKHTIEQYHSLIFAAVSVIGFELITLLYMQSGTGIFLAATFLFLFIFVFEAFLSLRFAQDVKSKLPLPHVVDEVQHIHISNHLILPSLLYLSIAGFIYFNYFSLQTEAVILIGAITFFSIFQGQRATFRQEFVFDETLHYIYDSIKIIIFFLATSILIQSAMRFSFSTILLFILQEALAFILLLLIIVRKQQFNSTGILYIFLASLASAVIVVLMFPHWGAITIALVTCVIFYLFIGVIHHKIQATLTFELISEYIIIALIILVALRGISG